MCLHKRQQRKKGKNVEFWRQEWSIIVNLDSSYSRRRLLKNGRHKEIIFNLTVYFICTKYFTVSNRSVFLIVTIRLFGHFFIALAVVSTLNFDHTLPSYNIALMKRNFRCCFTVQRALMQPPMQQNFLRCFIADQKAKIFFTGNTTSFQRQKTLQRNCWSPVVNNIVVFAVRTVLTNLWKGMRTADVIGRGSWAVRLFLSLKAFFGLYTP